MKKKIIILSLVAAGTVLWALYCGDREERLENKVAHFISTQNLPVPRDAEVVYWENQSWETGGGSCRLTLWADGRSELLVDPSGYSDTHIPRPRNGWSSINSGRKILFKRTQVFPNEEAIRLFQKVWSLGLQHIRFFEPNYVDGGGTVIATQRAGNLTKVIVPFFPEERKFSEEHVRYLAVSRYLGTFGLGEMAYEWSNGSQKSPEGNSLKAAPQE